jgi:hypothetical protein
MENAKQFTVYVLNILNHSRIKGKARPAYLTPQLQLDACRPDLSRNVSASRLEVLSLISNGPSQPPVPAPPPRLVAQ